MMVERHDDDALIIYTDGSCLSRPRRGGYAFRLVWVRADGTEQRFDVTGQGFVGATNNQMELTACVEGLKHVTGRHSAVPGGAYRKIVVYADSAYVVDNVYNARFVWPRTKWMTAEGEPVLNAELWRELIRLAQKAGRVVTQKNPNILIGAQRLRELSASGECLDKQLMPALAERGDSDQFASCVLRGIQFGPI
jgi:ribonuclease HI